MKNSNGDKFIDLMSLEFSKNYNIIVNKYCCSDFNVPQNRNRVIIIGIRKDLNILPYELKPLYTKDKRPPISSILMDKSEVSSSLYLSQKALDGINKKKEKMKEKKFGYGAQFADFDKPAYTITSGMYKDGYECLIKYNDKEIRRLSIKEITKIQSFPEDYIFCGSKKDTIIQIGNAVPVNFAYHIACHLKNILNNVDNNNNNNKENETSEIKLNKLTKIELQKMCKEKNIKGYSKLKKNELINLILN